MRRKRIFAVRRLAAAAGLCALGLAGPAGACSALDLSALPADAIDKVTGFDTQKNYYELTDPDAVNPVIAFFAGLPQEWLTLKKPPTKDVYAVRFHIGETIHEQVFIGDMALYHGVCFHALSPSQRGALSDVLAISLEDKTQ